MSRFSARSIRFAALGALIVLALGAVALYRRDRVGFGRSAGGPAAPGPPAEATAPIGSRTVAIPVEGVAAIRGTLLLSVSAAGEAAPARAAGMLARVGGRVLAVSVSESEALAPGQLLVRIDSTEYALDRAEAAARLRQAQAAFRELTLFDERITDERVRSERREAARSKSGLDAAEVALERAEFQLAQTRLLAPFAGRAADVKVVAGQWVRPGDPLLSILDLDPILVQVQVLEGELGYIRPGAGARVTFSAFPDTVFAGRIRSINPVVERQSRAATVTVAVANPHGRLLPGMYARVALDARRFTDRVLVPRSAILERDRRTMLFVYAPDGPGRGLAKWRYITTGLSNDSLVEIVPNPDTDSVAPGEIVLTGGQYTLVHDAQVQLVPRAAPVGGRPE